MHKSIMMNVDFTFTLAIECNTSAIILAQNNGTMFLEKTTLQTRHLVLSLPASYLTTEDGFVDRNSSGKTTCHF